MAKFSPEGVLGLQSHLVTRLVNNLFFPIVAETTWSELPVENSFRDCPQRTISQHISNAQSALVLLIRLEA